MTPWPVTPWPVTPWPVTPWPLTPRARAEGHATARRMNQMYGAYDISNDDKLYVLSTFVVMPIRWLDTYGWQRLTEAERVASANYYRALGRHMGIKGIPETHPQFAAFLDQHEREHFAFDEGALAVSEATLQLMATFSPNRFAPRGAVNRFARALMDDPLLDAFHYRRPTRWERSLAAGALRLRARVVRLLPARKEPLFARQLPNIRSYPEGYDVARLGTFPRGCPVPPSPADSTRAPDTELLRHPGAWRDSVTN